MVDLVRLEFPKGAADALDVLRLDLKETDSFSDWCKALEASGDPSTVPATS